MRIIGELYTTPDGTRPSDEDISQDQALMDEYFAPDLHERVRTLYRPNPNGGHLDPSFNLPCVDLD